MFSDELPHIDNLFYAVGNVEFHGARLSATGLGDSIEEAETLRDAEFAERKSVVLFGEGDPSAAVVGTAAGPDPDTALVNAILEAVERHASKRWWHRGIAASRPTDADLQQFDELQSIWRRRTPRRGGLLDITPRHGIPVFAAWSSTDDGRDLCFGTACRLQRPDAVRAALKELHQMEFGLDVIRYRQSNGLALDRRERILLARARRLGVKRCRELLNPDPESTSGMPMRLPNTPSQLDGHLAAYGITVLAAELPRTDDRYWIARAVLRTPCMAAASAGWQERSPDWAKWDLY